MNCSSQPKKDLQAIALKDHHISHFQKSENPKAFAMAMMVRYSVFVEEQRVPADHEQDDLDDVATHYLLYINSGENSDTLLPVGTARSFPYKNPDKTFLKIGRIAILKPYRGLRWGQILLKHILMEAHMKGYEKAVLDAQTQAIGFYERLGFVAEGKIFLDEEIPHIRMKKSL